MRKLSAALLLWLGLASAALAQVSGTTTLQSRAPGSGGPTVDDIATYTQGRIAGAPSASLSRGNRQCLVLGDSRTAQNTVPSLSTSSATEYSKIMNGWLSWLMYLTGQRFDFTLTDNYGVAGETTTAIASRVSGIIAASSAKCMIFLAGTNNWAAGISYAQTISDVQGIDTLFANAGYVRFYFAELPRGTASQPGTRLTASQLQNHLQYRQWIRTVLKNTPGAFVADAGTTWDDPVSTTGDIISALYTSDGLHEIATGAYQMAVPMAALINSVYPPVNLLVQTNSDQYNATNNPQGCLNTNPMFDGTGGTYNAGASGPLATGYSEATATIAYTRVYSQGTLATGRASQIVTLSGTGTTLPTTIRQVITVGNLAIGDRVQLTAQVEVAASATNISQISLQITDNATITAGDFRRNSATDLFPTLSGNITGIMRTPVYTLTTTNVQAQLNINVINGAAVSGVVSWGQLCLRKVP